MERLTIRNSEGIGVLKQPFECERCGDLQWSLPDLGNGSPVDRLAEYEDTGITPEQIREIDRLYAEKCKELSEIQKSYLTGMELANMAIGLKKLREYRELEEQGKLLKLPCAVGDMVYRINTGKKEPVIPMKVIGIAIRNKNDVLIQTEDIADNDRNIFSFKSIGKMFFLTEENAEAYLKNYVRQQP